MAAKTKVSRLESEIEKCRSEANWAKALDLTRQVSSKSQALEALCMTVVGESKLERFIQENPPNEENTKKARTQLSEARQDFQEALKRDPKAGLKLEIQMLLSKLLFVMGDYSGALSKCDELDLENQSLENVSNRRLRIVAEAYAIKGLCLEKIPASSSSRYKQAEHEELIVQCFERAGDLSLLQLQDLLERGRGTPTSTSLQSSGFWAGTDTITMGVGPMVEMAIQRSPIMYIRNGNLSQGIGRFRELLRAVETRSVQGLRQTLARQLAEVLLRGVCDLTYEPVDVEPELSTGSSQPLKPRKYAGENLFTPKNRSEEALLLLLVSESMATRDAILSRSPEHTQMRVHAFNNTTAVYDLLTIALVHRMQFTMLSETFDRAMKFSFEEFHIWYQFALSLVAAEKYSRALLVLKECIRIEQRNPVVYLLAARICFEHLHLSEQGLDYAQKAVDLGEDNPLLAKSCILLGMGFAIKADEARLQVTRQKYQRRALDSFQRAAELDRNDHLAEFHVALQLSILRQIPEALKHVRRALQLRSDHIHSLHLLALLLSAQKQYEDALKLIDATVQEYPNNFNLMFTKCKLEEVVLGTEEALYTCKQMLTIWKEIYEKTLENTPLQYNLLPQSPVPQSPLPSTPFLPSTPSPIPGSPSALLLRPPCTPTFSFPTRVFTSEQRGTGLIDKFTADQRSLGQLHITELSDRDSNSIRAESLAASRVEQALSEMASSINSSTHPKQGPNQTWTLQAQIWLHLGDLYLELNRLEEAQACIQEAGAISPVSHMVSYMKGRMHEKKNELYEAKQSYENAISIHPAHVKSLQHLGTILHQLGNDHLSEKVLRDAVNADPTSAKSWFHLGTTLQALGEYDAAAECLFTAVELESTSPINPFAAVIPRSIQ